MCISCCASAIPNINFEIPVYDDGDTADGLADDAKFLKGLEKNCDINQKLYDENVKYRSQELAALGDTIKIPNDDDALALFMKTLPTPSLVQRSQLLRKSTSSV